MHYDVGYGSPPKHSRFSPGTSGNPRGRPKGSKNVTHDLDELLAATDSTRVKGETKRTKFPGIMRHWVQRAIEGDKKALVAIFDLMLKHDDLPVPQKPRRGVNMMSFAEAAARFGQRETARASQRCRRIPQILSRWSPARPHLHLQRLLVRQRLLSV